MIVHWVNGAPDIANQNSGSGVATDALWHAIREKVFRSKVVYPHSVSRIHDTSVHVKIKPLIGSMSQEDRSVAPHSRRAGDSAILLILNVAILDRDSPLTL